VISGLLAGYGIAMPVGAIALFLIRLGAAACLCIAAAAGLGAASVDGGFAAAAVTGGARLARPIAAIADPLRAAAATVLVIVAVLLAVAAVRRYRAASTAPRLTLRTPLRAYATLASVTVLNPLTMVYWAALVLGQQTSTAALTPAQAAAFVAAVFAASASWQLILVSGGALIGRVAGGRHGTLAISMGSALLIAMIAIQILLH
jgi:arginine exporter protein ArgO